MPNLNFDATTVEPMDAFDPLPQGSYVAAVIESEMKETRAGDGTYLQLTWELIEDGPFKGRRVWSRITWSHPNEQAVTIGRATLSAICRAVGLGAIQQTEQLHNRPAVLRIIQRKRIDNGELANDIKKYTPTSGGVAGQPTQAAPPPWKKA